MKVNKYALSKNDYGQTLYFKKMLATGYNFVPVWTNDKNDCLLFKERGFAEDYAQGHFWKFVSVNVDAVKIVEIEVKKNEQ